MTQAEYIQGIEERVQDAESRLTEAIKIACLDQALDEYNKYRPRTLVEDLLGDGTAVLAIPTAWETGFSQIRAIDLQQEDNRFETVASQDYDVVRQPSGDDVIIFLEDDTQNGETYRVTFTVAHAIEVADSTVPSTDDQALMDLAASHAALRLAAAHFDNVDPTVGAVTVDNKTRADYYRNLAKDLRNNFDTAITGSQTIGQQGRFKTWAREQTGLFH